MTTRNENVVASPAFLAGLYGLAIGTLANWRAQGKGPAFKKRHRARNGAVTYPYLAARRWFKANGYPLAAPTLTRRARS